MMSLNFNMLKLTYDCVCDNCGASDVFYYSYNITDAGWGIKLNNEGYATLALCPDCKVGYDLELIQEMYGGREDLSYEELVAAQEGWYNGSDIQD